MADRTVIRTHELWARLRFAIVARLLAAPPRKGHLRAALLDLAGQEWTHPITGDPVRFGFSTLERWYYLTKTEHRDPVRALRRKLRDDAGKHRRMPEKLKAVLFEQYRKYDDWSYLLHTQNLAAEVEKNSALGTMPSYSTVRRFMKAHGLLRQPRRRGVERPGQTEARERHQRRETRSYEVPFVNGLWHLDYHLGSRKVLTPDGEWVAPWLLGILDDHSRLACHVQWYYHESADNLVHGICQAFQKRDLPAAVMNDNGSAMRAEEYREGHRRLGLELSPTLDYSPEQNGKQESFWGQIEGRLLPMLKHRQRLTLEELNEITQAWVEMEYNQKTHSEIGMPPIRRWLDGQRVGRPSPSSEHLRLAFMCEVIRTQRQSDGTIPLATLRYEVPSPYRHVEKLHVLYASWDLSQVYLVHPLTADVLCQIFPIDKTANADARRRAIVPPAPAVGPYPKADELDEIAPLLRKYMEDYTATGLPPAYLAKRESPRTKKKGDDQP